MDMRKKKIAVALAIAGFIAAGSFIYLAGNLVSSAVRFSISMFVCMLMLYPLIRMSSTVPLMFHLWRDKRLTFPRYVLVQAIVWSLLAIAFTIFR